MPRSPIISSLTGVWPIASYLHVPKIMPQPTWLMLASAFAIDKEAAGLQPEFAAKHEVLMLTAAHSFAPWRCFKVNIPDEYRRARYVTGKIMQYNFTGHGDTTRMCELGIVAVHPTVDVALVKVMDGKKFLEHCAAGPKDAPPPEDGEPANTNDVFGTFKLVEPPFPADAPDDATLPASVIGFRGSGDLGNTSQISEEQGRTMPAAERQKLIESHRNAVGRQEINVAKLALKKDPPVADVPPLVPTGEAGEPSSPASSIYSRGEVLNGACYAGMSGSPLVIDPIMATQGEPRNAAGLLFQRGLAENKDVEVLYVPTSAILPWLQSLK